MYADRHPYHDDHHNNHYNNNRSSVMQFSRFVVEIPAVQDLPDLASPAMSRSPSTISTTSIDSLSSSCTDRTPTSKPAVTRSDSQPCDAAYRSLQRENHDLRKQLGLLRQKLAITQHHLAEEQAKEDVLSASVADLQASLAEVRARSLDVLEENLALRADAHRARLDRHRRLAGRPLSPDGDVSPLCISAADASPLDRQLLGAVSRPAPRQQPTRPSFQTPHYYQDQHDDDDDDDEERDDEEEEEEEEEEEPTRRNAISPPPDSFFARSLADMDRRLSRRPASKTAEVTAAPGACPRRAPPQPPQPQGQQGRAGASQATPARATRAVCGAATASSPGRPALSSSSPWVS